MIRYKVNILALMKEKGISSYRIQKENIINQTAVQKLREGKMISWEQLGNVCDVLGCQPGDLLENVPKQKKSDSPEEIPEAN